VRQPDVFPLRIVKRRGLRAGMVAQLKLPFAVEVDRLARRFGGKQRDCKKKTRPETAVVSSCNGR